MSQKRKDNKGRILRTGESQRKDGIYQYRYTDPCGKRGTIYDRDLNALRIKEKAVQRVLDAEGNYSQGSITVYKFVKKYVDLKTQITPRTAETYCNVLKQLQNDPFAQQQIRSVKTMDAKAWAASLSLNGKGYSSIRLIFALLRPAFQEAVEDDVLPRNPFSFSLTKVVPDNRKEPSALDADQEKAYLDFVKKSRCYRKYLDAFIVLLETGMRISELCGLTLDNLDFENGEITIDHQLLELKGRCYICPPKSESGNRVLPMTLRARRALMNTIHNRKPAAPEVEIDGVSGFVFLRSAGKPCLARTYHLPMERIVRQFNDANPDHPLPNVTPHTLRHTFCTNLVHRGVDPTSVQYLMGHAHPDISLKVYSHKSEKEARQQMRERFAVGE